MQMDPRHTQGNRSSSVWVKNQILGANGKIPQYLSGGTYEIEKCAQFNIDNGYRKQDIAILTDSQAAITALSLPIVSNKMVGEGLKLNELGGNNKVTLLWVPGHRGIKKNEKAKILVKKGAETPFTGLEPFCDLGEDVTCKHKLKLKEQHKRAKLWEQLTGLVLSKKTSWRLQLGME